MRWTGLRRGSFAVSTVLAAALLLAVQFCGASAQMVRDHDQEGGVRGFHGSDATSHITRSFASDTEAHAEFSRILSAVGLASITDRITLRASAETANAEAAIGKSGEKFIFYNADFMQRVKQKTAEHWSLVSILAHETGHHLAFHTEVAGRYHEFELEADYFSGFVLRRLGASLDQSQTAMRAISPVAPTETHPGLQQRLQAITIGWTDGGSTGAPRGLKNVQNSVVGLDASTTPAAYHAGAVPRIALVVGNANYVNLTQLDNGVLDAVRVSSELEKRGFKVIKALNLEKDALIKVITEFESTLSIVGGVGLFYYAGQAVYIDGEDIMLPIDANADTKQSKITNGVNLTRLMKELQSRTTTPAKQNGVAVIYSASKGETAADGPPGGNSPFTSAFVDALNASDDELADTFRRIRAEMAKEVSKPGAIKQTPFFESSLEHKFYLARPDKDPAGGVSRILVFDSCRDNPFQQQSTPR